MYLYQAFNLRKQLISIFQRLLRIYRKFVWKALIWPINWSPWWLKVKHLTESTLCLKYFRNIVIVGTKGKNKKIKTRKIYLFLLPLLPSQDGGLMQPPTHPPTPHPPPKLLSWQKILTKKFHRYMGIWTKGGKIDRMEILAKRQKWYEGKSEGWGRGGL